MALRRFMGRRGVPECLYSNNGTGLMGARGHLIDFSPASAELLRLGVNWTTIPPTGLHMGGIWEAAVKSAKGLLKRQFARTTLSVLQLQTCMAEVEGILNSRPLAKLREDGDSILALTPAMLLTGFKHRMFPILPGRKPAELAVSKNPVQRYRYLQSLMHQFWRQWKEDYLALLQTRQKWLKKCTELQSRRPGPDTRRGYRNCRMASCSDYENLPWNRRHRASRHSSNCERDLRPTRHTTTTNAGRARTYSRRTGRLRPHLGCNARGRESTITR